MYLVIQAETGEQKVLSIKVCKQEQKVEVGNSLAINQSERQLNLVLSKVISSKSLEYQYFFYIEIEQELKILVRNATHFPEWSLPQKCKKWLQSRLTSLLTRDVTLPKFSLTLSSPALLSSYFSGFLFLDRKLDILVKCISRLLVERTLHY